MNANLSIIVLAAGLSTRFGRNKLLEPIGSTTLIEHVVSEAIESSARQVVVVCGYDFEKISKVLQRYSCEVVFNEEFAKGQSFSVRKGLLVVDPDADAVMILPGDMALTKRSIIDAVIDGYIRTHALIVSAGFEGRPGHPILFDRRLFEELKSIDEATRGLKKVVAKHLSEATIVETSAGALFDMDAPKDLVRFDNLRLNGIGQQNKQKHDT